MSARIRVRLTPRASRNEIVGWRANVLVVRVTAAPVDLAANAALERMLADALDVPRSAIRLVRGAKSRLKIVEIEELLEADALFRLGADPPVV